MINKCDRCGKTEESNHYTEHSAEDLPLGWCYIKEEACGVHDSDVVAFTYHYCLCEECRVKFRTFMKIAMQKAGKKKGK